MKDRNGRELQGIEYLTIEPSEYQPYAVYGHGEYERSSVLHGHPRRVFIESYDSVEEAQKDYPNAQVCEGSTKRELVLPDAPPDWFDPMAAGEVWHEDDY
jgi:hypothetical protein